MAFTNNKIFLVLISIFLWIVILLPLLLCIFLPCLIILSTIRICVDLLVYIQYGRHNIIHRISANDYLFSCFVHAANNNNNNSNKKNKVKGNVGFLLILNNNQISIESLQDQFRHHILNHPFLHNKYWKLGCTVQRIYGFYYWKKMQRSIQEMDLNLHIRQLELQEDEQQFTSLEKIFNLNLLTTSFNNSSSSSPLWDILLFKPSSHGIYSDKSIVLFRFHHVLSDGLGLSEFIHDFMYGGAQEHDEQQQQQQQPRHTSTNTTEIIHHFTNQLYKFITIPIILLKLYQIQFSTPTSLIQKLKRSSRSTDTDNDTNEKENQSPFILNYSTLEISKIKKVKQTSTNLSFKSIIHSCLAGAMRRFINEEWEAEASAVCQLQTNITVPVLFHQKRRGEPLENTASTIVFKFPLQDSNPKSRLRTCETNFNSMYKLGIGSFNKVATWAPYLLPFYNINNDNNKLASSSKISFCVSQGNFNNNNNGLGHGNTNNMTMIQNMFGLADISMMKDSLACMMACVSCGDQVSVVLHLNQVLIKNKQENATRIGQYLAEELEILININETRTTRDQTTSNFVSIEL